MWNAKSKYLNFKKKIWLKVKNRVHCQQNTENKNNMYTQTVKFNKIYCIFITMESYDKNENGYSLMDFQPYFVI